MREPLDNKATEPPRNKGEHDGDGVERFPRRVGNKKFHDRNLTPKEIKEREKDTEAMKRARAVRDRVKANARG